MRLASLVPILIAVAALLAVALVDAQTSRTGAAPLIPTIQQRAPDADEQPPSAPAQPALPTTVEPTAGSPSVTEAAPGQMLTSAPASGSSDVTAPAPMVAPSRWSEPVEGGAPTLAPPPQLNPKGSPPRGLGQSRPRRTARVASR